MVPLLDDGVLLALVWDGRVAPSLPVPAADRDGRPVVIEGEMGGRWPLEARAGAVGGIGRCGWPSVVDAGRGGPAALAS